MSDFTDVNTRPPLSCPVRTSGDEKLRENIGQYPANVGHWTEYDTCTRTCCDRLNKPSSSRQVYFVLHDVYRRRIC